MAEGSIKGDETVGFQIWSVSAAGLVSEGEQFEIIHRAEKEEVGVIDVQETPFEKQNYEPN